jgi:hypothetical protein
MFASANKSSDLGELTGEELHSKLVVTTIGYDAFNNRCRGVSVSVKEAKVNRLFIRKYSVTFNNYIKVYMSRDPRVAKAEIKQDIVNVIAEKGGCQEARKAGMRKDFKQDFRTLFRAVEASPWIPTISRER